MNVHSITRPERLFSVITGRGLDLRAVADHAGTRYCGPAHPAVSLGPVPTVILWHDAESPSVGDHVRQFLIPGVCTHTRYVAGGMPHFRFRGYLEHACLGSVEYQGCGAGLTGLVQVQGCEEEGHAGIFDDDHSGRWANPVKSLRDAADFACGRHFERLEGDDPTAPLEVSHRQNGPRQHRNPDTQQTLVPALRLCAITGHPPAFQLLLLPLDATMNNPNIY